MRYFRAKTGEVTQEKHNSRSRRCSFTVIYSELCSLKCWSSFVKFLIVATSLTITLRFVRVGRSRSPTDLVLVAFLVCELTREDSEKGIPELSMDRRDKREGRKILHF